MGCSAFVKRLPIDRTPRVDSVRIVEASGRSAELFPSLLAVTLALDLAYCRGVKLTLMTTGRKPSLGLLPILLAVVATGVYGWWSKQQPNYGRQSRRQTRPIREYPQVSIVQTDTGSPQARLTRGAGAAMAFEVYDDSERRWRPSRGVLGVTFTVVDSDGVTWETETYFHSGEILLTIPQGYARRPSRLTVQAQAAGKVIGSWNMPPLLEPKRVLSTSDHTERAPISVKRLKGGEDLQMELAQPIPVDEMWEITLTAHTYHRYNNPQQTTLFQSDRDLRLRKKVNGGTAGVEEVELSIRKHRSYLIDQTVQLNESSVRRIDSQPSIMPRPPMFTVGKDLLFSLIGEHVTTADQSTYTTMQLALSANQPLQYLSAKVVEPKGDVNGLRIGIKAGPQLRSETVDLQNPPSQPLGEGVVIREGPFPFSLSIQARPYKLFENMTVVVPVGN